MHATIDDRRRELRRLLEGMKAEPARRQMAEAYRYIALQRSLAVDKVAEMPVMLTSEQATALWAVVLTRLRSSAATWCSSPCSSRG